MWVPIVGTNCGAQLWGPIVGTNCRYQMWGQLWEPIVGTDCGCRHVGTKTRGYAVQRGVPSHRLDQNQRQNNDASKNATADPVVNTPHPTLHRIPRRSLRPSWFTYSHSAPSCSIRTRTMTRYPRCVVAARPPAENFVLNSKHQHWYTCPVPAFPILHSSVIRQSIVPIHDVAFCTTCSTEPQRKLNGPQRNLNGHAATSRRR